MATSLLSLAFLVFTFASPTAEERLLVDPRLIAEAAQVWSVIGRPGNEVWPGWDASSTPILFYMPGKQDLLINHPAPPEGFVPYKGPVSFPAGKIFIRTGSSFFELDGQNTSREIGGVNTLVVADTLSNLRMRLETVVNDPRPVREKFPPGNHEDLMENPYGQMAMVAHEAFHVFQHTRAPGKGADETVLAVYPVLSEYNNVGFALEGEALADAIRAKTAQKRRSAGVRWLAVRLDRRYNLPDGCAAYEDGNEFNEGLAKYVEYKLAQSLEGMNTDDAMKWVQGFHGNEGFAAFRESLIDQMVKHMRGEVNVNNDPYGTAPLRMRLYFSGMAIAVLLDELAPGWHDRIFEPGITLTGLAQAALDPSYDEMEQGLEQARNDPSYAALVESKALLEMEGREHVEKMLDRILNGENTVLSVDYSALKAAGIGMRYTPFGVTAVDEDRTIYTMVPVGAMFAPGCEFRQTEPSPVLHDRVKELFQMQLAGSLSREDLARSLGVDTITGDPVKRCTLDLPGVSFKARRATFAFNENTLTITLLP
jgi:hypothetical protein